MYQSIIHEVGHVHFPAFNNERHYMVPFMQKEGLPASLKHWQETVDDMLYGIETDQPIYFMADQAYVAAGLPHRRPGVHVDGYWVPDIRAHGGGGHGDHRGSGGSHTGRGRHSGYGRHASSGQQYGTRGVPHRWDVPNPWRTIDFSLPEAIVLASNVQGARAWTGLYDEHLLREGGSASAVPVELLAALDLEPHKAYIGNVGMLHASVPLGEDANRTMVRLNCPGVNVN